LIVILGALGAGFGMRLAGVVWVAVVCVRAGVSDVGRAKAGNVVLVVG
jgi:hypothetical protein